MLFLHAVNRFKTKAYNYGIINQNLNGVTGVGSGRRDLTISMQLRSGVKQQNLLVYTIINIQTLAGTPIGGLKIKRMQYGSHYKDFKKE